MKKLINIGVIIIVMIVIFSVVTKINVNAVENPEKGDLMCPEGSVGNGCEEIRDETTGRVTEVRVSTTQNGITVTKYVRRTEIVGQYEVQFGVSGSGQVTSSKNAYVMLILDGSSSLSDNYKNSVIPAAKLLASYLNQKGSNIYLAFASFHYRVFATRNFENTDFSNADFGTNRAEKCINHGPPCWLRGSCLSNAFDVATSYFKNVDGRKYLVILGDNIYSTGTGKQCQYPTERADKCDLPRGKNEIDSLKTIVDAVYSINYGKNDGSPYMTYFVKQPGKYISGNQSDLTPAFRQIAEQIGTDIEITCLSGTVTDTLGSHFSIVSGSRTYTFDTITSQGVLSDPFLIKIDSSLQNGWYPTNNGFEFRTSGDATISSHIDPLVYWEQEDMSLDSCSDSITFTNSDKNKYNYYTISCYQGYGKGDSKIGYSAELKINNLPLNKRVLSLGYGMGFTSTLSLINNIKCVSTFDYQAFNKRLNEIREQLDVLPENSNERAILLKELYGKDGKSGMIGENGELNTYQKIISQKLKLNSEQDRFVNQSATLTIKDSSNGNIKQVNLINSSKLSVNVSCSSGGVQVIEGKNIDVKYTCTAKFTKTMNLPEVCLNMHGGEQEECLTSSTTQISGGNRAYPNLSTTHGYISLLIPSAGYFKNDIKLDGERRDRTSNGENPRCEFTVGKRQSFIYRQIELSDPFLQTYSKTRKVGNNWSNKTYNYNFQNIIDEKIWNKTFEFKYQLSKVNVENIKNTTVSSNERVNGYLGTNCYINNNNKYICPFVGRNESEVKDLFTKVFINE